MNLHSDNSFAMKDYKLPVKSSESLFYLSFGMPQREHSKSGNFKPKRMIKSSIFLLVVLLSTINCNTLSNEGYVIKGRYINVLKTKNNPSDVKLYEICISNDSLVKILFKTEIDSLHNFGVIKLLKDSNRLIASLENYKYRQDYLVRKYDKTYIFSSDLVICDYQGTIIDTLYKSKQGEQIFHYYNSKNDKYVFFLSTEKKQQGFFCGFDNFNIYDLILS